MWDIVRDAPLGQVIRLLTGNKFLPYAEERPDWEVPNKSPNTTVQDYVEVPDGHGSDHDGTATPGLGPLVSSGAVHDDSKEATKADAGKETRYLVDWYSADDQDNPRNWSSGKKMIAALHIYLLTLVVYMAGAIYSPSIPFVIEQFDVSSNVASLGLSMYVLGYGVGPLILSPLSEIPALGRNLPYITTYILYIIICVPTALVDNFAGLVVLRFIQGFLGSPVLATGGASIADLYSPGEEPYHLTAWASFTSCAPAFGPLIAGFSVPAENWHWSLWEILWLGGPVLVSMLLLLPETSTPTVLLRRAARLRRQTGKPYVSQSELDAPKMAASRLVITAIWRPFEINILDPAVLFTSVYMGLIYGIFYSFFESFPLVYGSGIPNTPTHGYDMSPGQIGLIFLCMIVAAAIAFPIYFLYLRYIFTPLFLRYGLSQPERYLSLALYTSVFAPVGLFLFAWTGFNAPKVHWIVPTIGIVIYMIAFLLLLQCILFYLPISYPQYAASIFAGNGIFRSVIASGAIHFARPLFFNLGIGRGVSLLGGLTVGGILGLLVLVLYGDKLRARSRFAAGASS